MNSLNAIFNRRLSVSRGVGLGVLLGLIFCCSNASAASPTPDRQYLVCKYNTYASELNFLELSNTGTGSASFSASIPAASTHDGMSHQLTSGLVSMRSMQRLDVDIHSAVGRNAFGHVLVNYYGGKLRGGVSHYELVEGKIKQTAYVPCFEEVEQGSTFSSY